MQEGSKTLRKRSLGFQTWYISILIFLGSFIDTDFKNNFRLFSGNFWFLCSNIFITNKIHWRMFSPISWKAISKCLLMCFEFCSYGSCSHKILTGSFILLINHPHSCCYKINFKDTLKHFSLASLCVFKSLYTKQKQDVSIFSQTAVKSINNSRGQIWDHRIKFSWCAISKWRLTPLWKSIAMAKECSMWDNYHFMVWVRPPTLGTQTTEGLVLYRESLVNYNSVNHSKRWNLLMF